MLSAPHSARRACRDDSAAPAPSRRTCTRRAARAPASTLCDVPRAPKPHRRGTPQRRAEARVAAASAAAACRDECCRIMQQPQHSVRQVLNFTCRNVKCRRYSRRRSRRHKRVLRIRRGAAISGASQIHLSRRPRLRPGSMNARSLRKSPRLHVRVGDERNSDGASSGAQRLVRLVGDAVISQSFEIPRRRSNSSLSEEHTTMSTLPAIALHEAAYRKSPKPRFFGGAQIQNYYEVSTRNLATHAAAEFCRMIGDQMRERNRPGQGNNAET